MVPLKNLVFPPLEFAICIFRLAVSNPFPESVKSTEVKNKVQLATALPCALAVPPYAMHKSFVAKQLAPPSSVAENTAPVPTVSDIVAVGAEV